MYNEATDVGEGGWGGKQRDMRDFKLDSTSICRNRFWIAISFCVFSSSLFLLSLTCCNFVASSVPAGCDSPLLLIILNQEGLSVCLSLCPSLLLSYPPSLPLPKTDNMEKNETCA